MTGSRWIARVGVCATAIVMGASIIVIAVGSAKFSVGDLRSHGSALLRQPAGLSTNLTHTLAVTPEH